MCLPGGYRPRIGLFGVVVCAAVCASACGVCQSASPPAPGGPPPIRHQKYYCRHGSVEERTVRYARVVRVLITNTNLRREARARSAGELESSGLSLGRVPLPPRRPAGAEVRGASTSLFRSAVSYMGMQSPYPYGVSLMPKPAKESSVKSASPLVPLDKSDRRGGADTFVTYAARVSFCSVSCEL